jgi:hypothetical protein
MSIFFAMVGFVVSAWRKIDYDYADWSSNINFAEHSGGANPPILKSGVFFFAPQEARR